MTYGPLPREPRPPLYVVTHGLTLTAYQDGIPVARKTLMPHEAANLAIDLLTGLRMCLGNVPPSNTPNENLTPAEHIARRVAEGARNHAAEDDQA